ncbi:MAG: hypothetical protein ACK45H_02910 [Bacteroidota bacterium]|jgi:hypothetical protein
MKKFAKTWLFMTVAVLMVLVSSCKNDDPSTLKIFVRSANNELQSGAKVVVIGDVNSNPPTNAYVDTLVTNESGFVAFNMQEFFDSSDETTGYFDLVIKKDDKTAFGYVRCREHITTVETIFLPN